MRARRYILFLLVVGFLALGLYALLFVSREPRYQGRSLREWVALRGNETGAIKPSDYEQAIRQMGPSTVPYLVQWVEEPPWRYPLFRKAEPVLAKFRVPVLGARTYSLAPLSEAFRCLGPDADTAIAQLSSLLQTSTVRQVAVRAACCLASLGDKGAFPLLTGITNQSARFRDECLSQVPHLGSNALPLIPSLVECLKDQDPWFSAATATILANLKLRPEIVVPALIQSLRSKDLVLRRSAAVALIGFGSSARSAAPALQEALADPDADLRQDARMALHHIAPDYPTNAPSP